MNRNEVPRLVFSFECKVEFKNSTTSNHEIGRGRVSSHLFFWKAEFHSNYEEAEYHITSSHDEQRLIRPDIIEMLTGRCDCQWQPQQQQQPGWWEAAAMVRLKRPDKKWVIVNQQAKCILLVLCVLIMIVDHRMMQRQYLSSGLGSVKTVLPHTDPFITALILLLGCWQHTKEKKWNHQRWQDVRFLDQYNYNTTKNCVVTVEQPVNRPRSLAVSLQMLYHHRIVWWQYFCPLLYRWKMLAICAV